MTHTILDRIAVTATSPTSSSYDTVLFGVVIFVFGYGLVGVIGWGWRLCWWVCRWVYGFWTRARWIERRRRRKDKRVFTRLLDTPVLEVSESEEEEEEDSNDDDTPNSRKGSSSPKAVSSTLAVARGRRRDDIDSPEVYRTRGTSMVNSISPRRSIPISHVDVAGRASIHHTPHAAPLTPRRAYPSPVSPLTSKSSPAPVFVIHDSGRKNTSSRSLARPASQSSSNPGGTSTTLPPFKSLTIKHRTRKITDVAAYAQWHESSSEAEIVQPPPHRYTTPNDNGGGGGWIWNDDPIKLYVHRVMRPSGEFDHAQLFVMWQRQGSSGRDSDGYGYARKGTDTGDQEPHHAHHTPHHRDALGHSKKKNIDSEGKEALGEQHQKQWIPIDIIKSPPITHWEHHRHVLWMSKNGELSWVTRRSWTAYLAKWRRERGGGLGDGGVASASASASSLGGMGSPER